MKRPVLIALLLSGAATAFVGGAAYLTPPAASYSCTDGTVIKATYKKDSVLLMVGAQAYELKKLSHAAKVKYGDAEHSWTPNGKTAQFVIGAAGNKTLNCKVR